MTKLERVLAALDRQPVDRCAMLEQLSDNPRISSAIFRALVEVVWEERNHAIR